MGVRHVLEIWAGNAGFMAWNLTLALIPVMIGVLLFRRRPVGRLRVRLA